MVNVTLICIIFIITIIPIINTNNVFGDNKDQLNNDLKSIDQDNNQDNQCKDTAKCENQSIDQLNNQNNQCRDNAKCINHSTSNVYVCEEKSLCLIQYQGPFELSSPY